MPLGTEVGLAPGHIVLYGLETQLAPPLYIAKIKQTQ